MGRIAAMEIQRLRREARAKTIPIKETDESIQLNLFGEKQKMATLRDEAKAYVPPQTKNIADLDEVSTEVDIREKVVKEGTSDEFRYKYITVEGDEYRVPNSVLKQLKVQIDAKPSVTKFTVNKTGEGLNTEYTVVTLD